MLDVYFYEAFAEEAEALQALLPAHISAEYSAHTIQETVHDAPPSRLISIRTQSQLPPAWAPDLGGILTRSTGYDHLHAYVAGLKNPPALGYLPLYCHRAVAEHAMLLWMSLLRRLPHQVRQFKTFHRDGITGHECQGRTLAVVGVGYIGREVCQIGRALGMKVFGVDLNHQFDDVDYVPIETALPQADVLVCAMDLNKTNRGYFDAAKWRMVKPGLVFVNISRGELSPPRLLLEGLKTGVLSGVGMDVYDREPTLAGLLRSGKPTDDPEVLATVEMSQREDCICTPHNAFNSAEAVLRKSDHSIQQIVEFLEKGAFHWSPPS
jgi:D-lactate dehydrogenase